MLITSVPNIAAADIINAAEILKKQNLHSTKVNMAFYDDHISVLHPDDNHLLSYIPRDAKSPG